MEPSSTAKQQITTKNNKGKLRRPLSAYNLYFRKEREVIREAMQNGATPEDYTKHVDAALKRLKGKRGAAEFQAVASTIAARWKALPSDERSKYEKLAEAEMEEYKERKFEYHRTLVKECEMAARGKTPDSSKVATTEDAAGAAALQGLGKPQGTLQFNQDPNSLASFMALPRLHFPNPSATNMFPSSFPGIPSFAPATAQSFMMPTSSFVNQQQQQNERAMLLQQSGMLMMPNKDYDGEIFSLRQQILRERLFLEARQEEEKMRQMAAAMQQQRQQQNAQAQEEQMWLMERQLELMQQQQQRSGSPTSAGGGGEAQDPQAKRAALAAMIRASLSEK